MSMQTECPHCHTVFRVSEEQLEKANAQLRCGHCLAIFTAESPYQNQQHNALSTNHPFDDAEESPTGDHQPLPDVIPPELRAETRSNRHHYSITGTVFLSLGILTMIIGGLLQYAYYDRLKLLEHTELRPALEMLCRYTGCQLPDPRDPSRIKLSSKNIYTHPNTDNALMVSATIVNEAEYQQDFPLLELRFENIRGEAIAARRFRPEEYLDIPQQQLEKIQPGEPVSLNIEIIDPGKDVMTYEFNFL